jgi:uncharacterized damage-inducible protein DinB
METPDYPSPQAMATVWDHHRRDSRKRLLEFLSTLSEADFVRPLPEAGMKSVRDLIVHTVDASGFWINLIRNRPHVPMDPADFPTPRSIVPAADEIADRIHDALTGADREWFGRETTVSHGGESWQVVPMMAVMHMLTHEYHHKGQIVMLARMLGYRPPDTDLL